MKRLKEMILSGELAAGERVTEAALAERLKISRTPIRNTLPRLAAEGFLEAAGRRGFRVKSFSEVESWEALELRALLEGQAAKLLAQRGADSAVLEALEQCLAEGDRLFDKRYLDGDDEAQYGLMNEKFHNLIVDSCGSPMLKTFVDRLNLIPFVAPSVVLFDQIGLRHAFDLLFRAHGVHHAIVDAIQQRDGNRAETLFREHAHQQRLSMFSRRSHPATAGHAVAETKQPRKRRANPAK